MSFPTISDDPGDVYLRFEITAQPAMVVVQSDGRTRTLLGAMDDSTLDSILTEATASDRNS